MKPGDASNFTFTVTDTTTGLLVNTIANAEMHLPDGSIVQLNLSNPSTGIYKALAYLWTLVGIYTLRFISTGPYAKVQEQQFLVAPLDF